MLRITFIRYAQNNPQNNLHQVRSNRSMFSVLTFFFNLNNIYLENNQNIQYIKHSKYRQDSETSNYCFYKSVSCNLFFNLPCDVEMINVINIKAK
jgi:hypothetical protein